MQEKVKHSKAIADINILDYDIIFLSGGWGAAYDFAQSDKLSELLSKAYANKKVLGAVCHGPLGFIGATKPDGSPLVKNVKMTGVTNKQIKELLVGRNTQTSRKQNCENAGAKYEHRKGIIDMFKNHVVVDEEHLIVTGQNQKGGIEAAEEALNLLEAKINNA